MATTKSKVKAVTKKIKHDNEVGARKALLEDLFYDFNRSRAEIYKMNFVRGIFFALGSIVGGAFAVVLIVWILNQLVDLPGGIGGFVQSVLDAMDARS